MLAFFYKVLWLFLLCLYRSILLLCLGIKLLIVVTKLLHKKSSLNIICHLDVSLLHCFSTTVPWFTSVLWEIIIIIIIYLFMYKATSISNQERPKCFTPRSTMQKKNHKKIKNNNKKEQLGRRDATVMEEELGFKTLYRGSLSDSQWQLIPQFWSQHSKRLYELTPRLASGSRNQ